MYQNIHPTRQLLFLFCLYAIFSALISSLISVSLPAGASNPPKIFLGLFSIVSFLLPAWIVQRFLYAKNQITRDKTPGNQLFKAGILSILTMLCAIIIMNWLSNVNQQIPVSASYKEAEAITMTKQREYMQTNSLSGLAYNLLIFSLIPAICEEVFFRGTMQPLLQQTVSKKWLAILITAIVFSLFHFQLLGFLPRLFAGIILGIIFVATKNIIIPIVCHFIYNSFVVAVNYADQFDSFDLTSFEQKLLRPYFVIGAFILVIALVYKLREITGSNKEPGSNIVVDNYH